MLAEIIKCTNPQKIEKEIKERHLFPGTSSVLLSPCSMHKKSSFNVMEETDQLRVILDVLGPQSDIDKAFITSSKSQGYHEVIQNIL